MDIIKDKDLIDPFRELHGEIKNFTWRHTNPIQQGRLDFFLLSNDLYQYVRKCDIDVSYK